MATDVGSLRFGFEPLRVSHYFLAIDTARFCAPGEFRQRVEHLTHMIKSTPAAAGYDEVLVASEPEWRAQQQRVHNGIPLPEQLLESVSARAETLAVPLPRPIGAGRAQ